ncbi:MAG: hypothetical protein JO247_23365 [Chloroflexi bacterium]|nr:hypothetical protein [Chloroflexota bacterium]
MRTSSSATRLSAGPGPTPSEHDDALRLNVEWLKEAAAFRHPRLREAGVSDADIRKMTHDNPYAILQRQEPY